MKREKTKGRRSQDGRFGMWAAKKPARKRKFLFGGYYSLDRGPLMGTKVLFKHSKVDYALPAESCM
jgi:hypothetical protein